MSELSRWVEAGLARLESDGLLRALGPIVPEDSVHVRSGDWRLTLFSSNDYLGLSAHPEVRRAAIEVVERYGMGPRGSPLICGYTDQHEALEAELAALFGTEAALLFPTGYAANLAVLETLADDGTTVFSDELNHASIIDGCRLARRNGATVHTYRHCDATDLESKLAAAEGRKLIATESVFSMDGDVAPLRAIAEVAERHGAALLVDESHATLVFGERGGGVCQEQCVVDRADVRVGTLSKAVGALGGFAVTSPQVRRWLLNRGRAYVFSTASPLPVVAAARAALRIGTESADLRRRLWSRVETLARILERPAESPITKIVLETPEAVMQAQRRLFDGGFHVVGIRPPSVPAGTARLRVTVSADHTLEEVRALGALIIGDTRRSC